MVADVGVGVGVEQPERHIHALDLGDAVLAAEQIRQQALALHMVAQGGLGRFFVELEGNDVVGLQVAGQAAVSTMGLPQNGQAVAAVLSSHTSSPPQLLQV